jgi:hypothetical protein
MVSQTRQSPLTHGLVCHVPQLDFTLDIVSQTGQSTPILGQTNFQLIYWSVTFVLSDWPFPGLGLSGIPHTNQ